MLIARLSESSPLAQFVRRRLWELGIRQCEFCRLNKFDQGLFSKIINSSVTSLSLESVLKLSIGLSVSPKTLLSLLGRLDVHDLVLKSYARELDAEARDGERPERLEAAEGEECSAWLEAAGGGQTR